MPITYNELKNRLYEITEKAIDGDRASLFFDIFIISLIWLNVLAVIIGTVKIISEKYQLILNTFEIISVIIFTIEYFLRLWSCTSNPAYRNSISGRIKYILTPLAIIDLLAILPFYIPFIIPLDLRFLRAVRLIRLFRLFKIGRYSETVKTFGIVFKAKKEDLLITLFAIVIILILASSLMYYVENNAQPENFSSIPAVMWWGIATLTTVGYGDVYPITITGKILGAVIAILGIGLFALPAGIFGSGFFEEIQRKKRRSICPHCGKETGHN